MLSKFWGGIFIKRIWVTKNLQKYVDPSTRQLNVSETANSKALGITVPVMLSAIF
jgi:hypothetical protein